MNLNLTGNHIDGSVEPDEEDLVLLIDALSDVDRIDEVVTLLGPYAPRGIIVDVSDECLAALIEELPETEIYVGGLDEPVEL